MTIKTIRIKNNIKFSLKEEREVKILIICISLFTASMIIGAGMMKNANDSEFLSEFCDVFKAFITKRTELKAYQIFFNSLSIGAVFFLCVFFGGLSCVGLPVIISSIVIKGFGYGMLAGYLIVIYKISGFGFYLLTIFPGAVIFTVSLLFMSCISAHMSIDILSSLVSKKQGERKTILSYLKQSVILALFFIFSSAVDTILTKAFIDLFTF